MSKDSPITLDPQIIELETRLAFQDDLIEQLNSIVSNQQRQLDRLEASLNLIAEKLKGAESGGAFPATHLDDEPPPHY
jgi:SlyX protein